MRQAFISPEGFAKLEAELDDLWRRERVEICKKVNWAAALGDRSENADYQYNKKRLREIDRRVRYLQRRLGELKIVAYNPQQEGKVFFGAWVLLVDDNDKERWLRIVGYDEIFHNPDYISVDAPLARALLGKTVDCDVELTINSQQLGYTILAIEYNRAQD